jgi:cell division protein FtsW (lipid II flippase)
MRTDQDVKAQLTPAGKFALLLMLCEIVIFAIALVFGQPELGLSSCISIAILLIVLRATWKLHEHVWYWVTVVVAAALQVPFNFYVPLSNHAFRGVTLVVFGLLDFIVVWGCIKTAEKLMNRA